MTNSAYLSVMLTHVSKTVSCKILQSRLLLQGQGHIYSTGNFWIRMIHWMSDLDCLLLIFLSLISSAKLQTAIPRYWWWRSGLPWDFPTVVDGSSWAGHPWCRVRLEVISGQMLGTWSSVQVALHHASLLMHEVRHKPRKVLADDQSSVQDLSALVQETVQGWHANATCECAGYSNRCPLALR